MRAGARRPRRLAIRPSTFRARHNASRFLRVRSARAESRSSHSFSTPKRRKQRSAATVRARLHGAGRCASSSARRTRRSRTETSLRSSMPRPCRKGRQAVTSQRYGRNVPGDRRRSTSQNTRKSPRAANIGTSVRAGPAPHRAYRDESPAYRPAEGKPRYGGVLLCAESLETRRDRRAMRGTGDLSGTARRGRPGPSRQRVTPRPGVLPAPLRALKRRFCPGTQVPAIRPRCAQARLDRPGLAPQRAARRWRRGHRG
jgi:hypothetical protein